MSEKLFRRLLLALFATCAVITVALLAYTVHLYLNCSIISFIARGR